MIRRIHQHLEQASGRVIMTLGLLLVSLLGTIDVITGYEVSFSIFYLIPIVMVSTFGRRSMGAAISVLSAAAWLSADLVSGHEYRHAVIPLWNAVMRLGIFLMVTYLITENRRLLKTEQDRARTDPLTGAVNSRAVRVSIEQELRRACRSRKPVTLVYLDVDNFKQVNDTQGHGEGDRLLVAIAESIRGDIRHIDVLGRLGGDEFAVLMPETGEREAQLVVQRVKDRLRDVARSNRWPVTFSFGMVTSYDRSCAVDDLIRTADALMYRSKAGGKDRITADVRTAQEENGPA